nr:synaptobrevin, WD40/YVTN repeat-like-containing domain protein [Tanacetum cinerariifolium]
MVRLELKFVLDIPMQYNASSLSFAHHMGSTSSEQGQYVYGSNVSGFCLRNDKPLRKVKLEKPCCWTSTMIKMIKLVDWCHSEELEIRSLCDLELVKVTSLMMILR